MHRHHCPLLVLLALGYAVPARAHLGVDFRSLNTLLAGADLVVVGRVLDPDRIYRRDDLAFQQQYIEIQVLECLKGTSTHRRLDFFGHGHGIAHYRKGDEALFFFTEITRDPMWKASPLVGRFAYFSDQEVQHKFLLTPENRNEWIDACRRYLQTQAMPPGPDRAVRLRDITLDLIGGLQERLALLAMQDLAPVRNIYEAFSPDQIARIRLLADDPAVNVRIRLILVQKLAADPSIPLVDKLLAMFSQADQPADKATAIQVLSRCRDERIVPFFESLLQHDDLSIRRAAIDGLAQPGLESAVPLLARALDEPASPVHPAMIRALGRIGTPNARIELQRLSETHPGDTVRRYAAAELRRPSLPASAPTSAPTKTP